ncbi:hypothetical protein [Streptomyces atratus]|uniref:hypothetical protein n=1 Tax=Streptomyces atratus TaxID=1893 RepID=UPI0021A548B8|nr:hypothetical protein [Streptomyces atratus]MCT2546122.1 hypothetical protein [Streptomyces atratus]
MVVPVWSHDRALDPFTGHRTATSALETAFLDARLRGSGESFGSHLGAVDGYVAEGYVPVKLRTELTAAVSVRWAILPATAHRL